MNATTGNRGRVRPQRAAVTALIVVASVFGAHSGASARTASEELSAATSSESRFGFDTFRASSGPVDPGPPLAADGRRAPRHQKAAGDTFTTHQAASAVCEMGFSDFDALDLLADDGLSTFVPSPFYNQACGDSHMRAWTTNTDHFHIAYADPEVTACLDSDNDFGTAYGAMARGAFVCEPIDPLTEPRGVGHTMLPADQMRFDRYSWGLGSQFRAFRVERIRIVTGTARVCFQLLDPGPWEAAGPAEPGESGGGSCWIMEPGYYDISAYTEGAGSLTLDSAPGTGTSNVAFDDLRFSW